MAVSLSRVFSVRREEMRLVLILGALLLVNSLAIEISGVVALSGFVSQVGVSNILIVWIVDMLVISAAAGLQSLIIDRFERVVVLRGAILAVAATYIVLRLMFLLPIPDAINFGILYILVDLQWLFFPLIFWILAGELFDTAQSKRLFPVIASMGFVGQIIGLVAAAVSPTILHILGITSVELLLVNVTLYGVTFLIVVFGLRGLKARASRQKHETIREALSEGWGFVREVPAFRFLMLSFVALASAITIAEYHFLVIADTAFTDADQFQTFYSLYRVGEIIASILLQSFITGRIINRFGLKNTFAILPGITLTGLIGMLMLPGIVTGAGGRLLAKLTMNTIDESARKSFQTLVPEERRGRVSMFMDSYALAAGVIIGALTLAMTLAVVEWSGFGSSALVYLIIALAQTVLSVWSIMRMRQQYDASLMNWRLKRRQRAASVLDKLDF